jgi:3-oxoacyl-[acyl-carrier protein] reductase
MDLHLQGRVAMVAAASKGLGRACAEALAAEGCRVSICARGDMDAVSTAELRVTADVSRAEDLARWHAETEARLGAVDILVTNTGGPPVGRFMDLDEGKWAAGVDSTLLSVIRLTRLVVPSMRARRWGRIIHLTSLVAKQPTEELTVSSTLRAGLSGLTKTLASELGADGITVNAILTGHVLTDRQEHLIEVRMKERGATREQVIAASTAAIPIGRMGRPEEIGAVVAFLASEKASFLTGVSLPVDGGNIRSTF